MYRRDGRLHDYETTAPQEHRPGAVYSWGLVAADGRLGYVDDEVKRQALGLGQTSQKFVSQNRWHVPWNCWRVGEPSPGLFF